ncbi:hypothetical protein FB451DRAFT_1555468 [Mycena latifolia]|nr:hypothetical protein FB451DRAFT_1555468 [Mycena latifolia]
MANRTQASYPSGGDSISQDYCHLRAALDQNPQLHSILAIALVFFKAPSPLQIAHVLDVPWEDVQQSLQFAPGLLDPPARYHSDILISDQLRGLLLDPACTATCVDLRRWHAFVAVWCLESSSSKFDARDIFYASDFWAQHVCSARPSQAIWDALRRSPVPCRLTSHAMLPQVIAWLETVDVEDTRELIAIYRTTYVYRQTAAALTGGLRVEIMGGLMTIRI